MTHFNFQSPLPPRVLGTDLDGTLIPLPDSAENRADLRTLAGLLAEQERELVFATGRHFESVLGVIDSADLPEPQWIVCDVGTTVCRRTDEGYRRFRPYEEHLSELIGRIDRGAVEQALRGVSGLTLQDDDSQGPFKVSYFCEDREVRTLAEEIMVICGERKLPFNCMPSVDPFTNRGLLDLLPKGVSKAYALIWLSTHADFDPSELVYAGDSGNDHAALVAGFRAIAVGNMDGNLAAEIAAEMAEKGWSDRFYRASAQATSGVLEGCRHFGLVE